jgi:hypothetical protein
MKNARQKLCRAFLGLCRAPRAHGKPQVSRSATSKTCRKNVDNYSSKMDKRTPQHMFHGDRNIQISQ